MTMQAAERLFSTVFRAGLYVLAALGGAIVVAILLALFFPPHGPGGRGDISLNELFGLVRESKIRQVDIHEGYVIVSTTEGERLRAHIETNKPATELLAQAGIDVSNSDIPVFVRQQSLQLQAMNTFYQFLPLLVFGLLLEAALLTGFGRLRRPSPVPEKPESNQELPQDS